MANFAPKKSASKAKSGQGPAEVMSKDAEHQEPPRMYLEHHHLEKLGMKKMPSVGSKVRISGLAHVGATSEDHDSMAPAGGKGGMKRRMTLNMHEMEIGADGPDNDEEQAEQSKAGAKAEMDKALARGAGSESKKGGKKS